MEDKQKSDIQLCSQTDFPLHTGIFRWGCFFMALGAWPQLQVQKCLTKEQILSVYHYCRTTKNRRNKYILEMEIKKYKLNCNDPTRALQIWLDFMAPGRFKGWQSGDQGRFYTWVPKAVYGKETFRLWRFTTMRSGPSKGHFILTDVKGNILYNPDTKIHLKERSAFFRRFYVKET